MSGVKGLHFMPKAGSAFARNVAVLATGSVAGQAVVVLSTPILTRLYTPAELGVLAIYMSLLTMALAFASLRYELAIPIPKSARVANDVVILSFMVLTFVSLVVSAIILLFGNAFGPVLGSDQLGGYIWFLPIGLFAAGTYQILSYWAIRDQAFSTLARTKFTQSVSQAATQILLGLAKVGTLGLIVGDIVGRAGGAGRLASSMMSSQPDFRKMPRLHRIRRVAARYRRFPLVSSGAYFLNTAGLQLPSLLLAITYGPTIGGLFALSQRAVGIPMRFLGRSIGQVYHGEAARLHREEPGRLLRLFNRTTKRLLLIGLVPLALAAGFGPYLFGFVFGDEWALSGEFVQLLAPALIAQFVVSPVSQTSAVLERHGAQLGGDVLRVILVVASIVVPFRFGFSANVAVGTYAASMALTYGIYYSIYRGIIRSVETPTVVTGL